MLLERTACDLYVLISEDVWDIGQRGYTAKSHPSKTMGYILNKNVYICTNIYLF